MAILKNIVIASLITSVSINAFGKGSETDSITPTFFFETRGGMAVYKSQMVESNDTATSVSYGFGVYSGMSRNLGMGIITDTSTVAFELNNSSIAISWQDTFIRYRFGPVYFGAIVGTNTLIVAREDDAETTADETLELDIIGSGYGGNFGLQIPLRKGSYIYLDAVSLTPSNARDAEKTEVAFGSRTDMDIGANIPLTKKSFDFLFGYKYRTYVIAVNSTSYTELHTSTYIGFQYGTQF